jgi:signal transduction histidine kinase
MHPQATSPADEAPGPEPALDEVGSFPVLHDGEVVGALEVVKPRGTALSTSERSLITDLAGSAGAVLGYQQLNDSLTQRARELEASRQRLVEAQGLERRRLERELHEGAEQFIVALKVKLGVATQLAHRQGAADLESLLDGLTEEAQAALDDVRSLAKGIYPPILESDGLGAAVSALAASTPVEVKVERDGIGRYPIDIEAAVYFDISEAVTNAVKHAESPIAIELAESAGTLRFSVRDSGPGFELDTHQPGSGLENMADRMSAVGGTLGVETSVGAQTVVWGSVPLQTEVSTEGSKSDLETKATAPASSALA